MINTWISAGARSSASHVAIFPGGYTGEVTPVPIPNTEVKLSRANGTAGATLWESRTPPGFFRSPQLTMRASTFFGAAREQDRARDREPDADADHQHADDADVRDRRGADAAVPVDRRPRATGDDEQGADHEHAQRPAALLAREPL